MLFVFSTYRYRFSASKHPAWIYAGNRNAYAITGSVFFSTDDNRAVVEKN